MIARLWRGWTAVESADEVAAHLRDVTLAAYAARAGNVSVSVLSRPVAGGVEVMTLSTWESEAALPSGVEESHRLLIARETIPAYWQVAEAPIAIAQAA